MIIGGLFVAAVGSGSVLADIRNPGCDRWQVVASPHVWGVFDDVSGTSSNDVWAAGSNGGVIPIIQHWDGGSWTDFQQGGISGGLLGVVAIAADDAYAVGDSDRGGQWTLIEHWDGVEWSVLTSPNRGLESYLRAVDALSSTDVWATGYFVKSDGSSQPLYEHWDGVSWQIVPEAAGTEQSGGIMQGIDAIASNDVWAVGYKGAADFFDVDPLIEHWDGTAWSVVPDGPPPSGGADVLHGVSGSSPTDVWTVGVRADGPDLIEHWDGSTWTRMEPNIPAGLFSAWSLGPDDAWAVGGRVLGRSQTLAIHWDGFDWTKVRSSDPGLGAIFKAVTAVSPTYVWAVGLYTGETGNVFPLTERTPGVCP